MVAASKSASATREPVAADAYLVGRAGGQELHDLVVGGGLAVEHARESLLGLQEPLADAFAQLARGQAREGHEEDLVQRDAGRHVPGRERGDRVRLAGPRARLEDGHPCGEWTADVEAAGLAHRVSTFSWAKTPAHRRRARTPKRVPSVACQSRSSGRGGGASRNSRGCWPPKASRCSGSLSSLSKRNSEAHSREADRSGVESLARRLRVGVRRLAGDGQRLAQPAVHEIGEHGEVLERGRAPALRIVTERPDPRD